MPEVAGTTPPGPVRLCGSAELAERGRAHVWELREYGRPARGFVLRFDGVLRGYLNRCLHVPVEMDWQPGEFLDADRRWILCSIHGAAYEPAHGRCVAGPCGRGRLVPLDVRERGNDVYWYPLAPFSPVPSLLPPRPPEATGPALVAAPPQDPP